MKKIILVAAVIVFIVISFLLIWFKLPLFNIEVEGSVPSPIDPVNCLESSCGGEFVERYHVPLKDYLKWKSTGIFETPFLKNQKEYEKRSRNQ